VRWSVVVEAEGDRPMTREEIVELADAVAASSGIASGIGTTRYGAQVLVVADTEEEALRLGSAELVRAAAIAGLPAWPVSYVEATAEGDEGYVDDGER
jgi:hypothetical protein